MTQRTLRTFWTEDRAAISPLYAVGILALVAVSGVGFDYGRLMALDSELQNAADQAALAAVTQLDGGEDAMSRARDAANNTLADADSTFVNETRFANDKRMLPSGTTSTRPIVSLSYRFFDDYADDALGDEITDDVNGADAKVVEVTVNARRAFYALTPVVGAVASGPVIGRALAGLESATCNVPPMMFCVPEVSGVADTDFPGVDDIGKGLSLRFKANGPDTPANPNDPTTDDSVWAPGNFGFLDLEYASGGSGQNTTTGLNAAILGCTGQAPTSDPGFRAPQGNALNTRFDMYRNPAPNCDTDNGDFCPAENVRRDEVNIQDGGNNVEPADVAGLTCSSTPSNNWDEIADLPTNISAGDLQQLPPSQIFPQDDCFLGATPNCDMIGDTAASAAEPNWDAAAYLALHHGGVSLASVAPGGTRYEVYQWELEDADARLASPQKVGYRAILKNNGKFQVDLYCAFPQPVIGTGVAASSTQKDRRILTVAAVDCTALNGKSEVKVVKWVDMFLVQPVAVTAGERPFFTEIIGPAKQANGNAGFQYFGRKKAVLIR